VSLFCEKNSRILAALFTSHFELTVRAGRLRFGQSIARLEIFTNIPWPGSKCRVLIAHGVAGQVAIKLQLNLIMENISIIRKLIEFIEKFILMF
jgi:hypothetical protein